MRVVLSNNVYSTLLCPSPLHRLRIGQDAGCHVHRREMSYQVLLFPLFSLSLHLAVCELLPVHATDSLNANSSVHYASCELCTVCKVEGDVAYVCRIVECEAGVSVVE